MFFNFVWINSSSSLSYDFEIEYYSFLGSLKGSEKGARENFVGFQLFLLLKGKGKLKNYYSSALGGEGEANAVERFKMVICFVKKLRALTKGEWGLNRTIKIRT